MMTGRLEREITVVSLDGETTKGVLWIGNLEPLSDGRWRCGYSIPVINPEVFALKGDDALQAFDRTMRFVRDLIIGSVEDGFQIWWRNPGDFGGFYC